MIFILYYEGYYCPSGSFSPVACQAGFYQPLEQQSNSTSCTPCAQGYYQPYEGIESCFKCSASSTSFVGESECTCVGKNRAFQPSDGQCLCLPGFEYVDAALNTHSALDGVEDCQPIVYPRCSTGEVRSSSGICASASTICDSQCGADIGGNYNYATGECQCNEIRPLDEVCDAVCRENADSVTCDDNGDFVINQNGTLITVDPKELDNLQGSISCSSDSNVYPMASVNGSFSGTFGVGSELSKFTSASRRRLFDMEYAPNNTVYHFLNKNSASRILPALSSEPTILNPLVCINIKDVILFSISNTNYPVYDKDSLLNTNPVFDYGSFRDLASSASSSVTVSSFAFAFNDPGTYVFSLSSNQYKKTIIEVMPADVVCSTDSHFVEFTSKNMVTMGKKFSLILFIYVKMYNFYF